MVRRITTSSTTFMNSAPSNRPGTTPGTSFHSNRHETFR